MVLIVFVSKFTRLNTLVPYKEFDKMKKIFYLLVCLIFFLATIKPVQMQAEEIPQEEVIVMEQDTSEENETSENEEFHQEDNPILEAQSLSSPIIMPMAAIEYAGSYSELLTAVANVNDGGIILITNDFSISGQITIPSGKSITIMSDSLTPWTLTRGHTGALFRVVATSSLRLANITLDGVSLSANSPLIQIVAGGECILTSGTTLQNALSSGNGGAVNMTGGTLIIEDDAIISGNTANNGGAISITSGTFTMKDDAVLSSNTASGNGGAVMVSASNTQFIMEGGTITSNNARNGGAVYVATTATFKMDNGSITLNNATGGNGGGINIAANSTLEMNGGEISANTTNYGGAGIFISGTATMNGGAILSNVATGNGGGVSNSGVFNMIDGIIVSNTAGSSGGGVYINSSADLNMTGGTIHSNINFDISKVNTGIISTLTPSSTCSNCGRVFEGFYKESTFITEVNSFSSGIIQVYAKYVYVADPNLNSIDAPDEEEIETGFVVQGNGTGLDPLHTTLFIGDTQYVSISAQLGSNPEVYFPGVGRTDFANLVGFTPGNYMITVVFQKQVWNGTAWVDIPNVTDTKQKAIEITPKKTAPLISGQNTITLIEGYTSVTSVYTVTGYPVAALSVTGLPGVTIDPDGTLHIPDGLAVGMYSLTIVATNGLSPDDSFIVRVDVMKSTVVTPPGTSPGTDTRPVPKTGNSQTIGDWAILGLLPLCCFGLYALIMKKCSYTN